MIKSCGGGRWAKIAAKINEMEKNGGWAHCVRNKSRLGCWIKSSWSCTVVNVIVRWKYDSSLLSAARSVDGVGLTVISLFVVRDGVVMMGIECWDGGESHRCGGSEM